MRSDMKNPHDESPRGATSFRRPQVPSGGWGGLEAFENLYKELYRATTTPEAPPEHNLADDFGHFLNSPLLSERARRVLASAVDGFPNDSDD
jgi:hypothetical protein